MSDKSRIEWTDATWNPIVGCSIVSPACTNCYAMAQAARIERMAGAKHDFDQNLPSIMTKMHHYDGLTQPSKAGPVWTGKVALAPESVLTKPLHWKRPRRIFVNSMSDLFHEAMTDEWIDWVFSVMALAPQHTFQVLTKRAKRMREYFEGNVDQTRRSLVNNTCFSLSQSLGARFTDEQCRIRRWPLPNVWLGVTAEDQPRADERRDDLHALSLAGWRTFVSYEPAIDPVDWRLWTFLNWFIAGGESGPNARPAHPDWFRAARDFCDRYDIPFFFKQWGEFKTVIDREKDDPDWRADYSNALSDSGQTRWINLAGGRGFHGDRFHVMRRVGKRRAGSLLDDREHKEFPE